MLQSEVDSVQNGYKNTRYSPKGFQCDTQALKQTKNSLSLPIVNDFEESENQNPNHQPKKSNISKNRKLKKIERKKIEERKRKRKTRESKKDRNEMKKLPIFNSEKRSLSPMSSASESTAQHDNDDDLEKEFKISSHQDKAGTEEANGTHNMENLGIPSHYQTIYQVYSRKIKKLTDGKAEPIFTSVPLPVKKLKQRGKRPGQNKNIQIKIGGMPDKIVNFINTFNPSKSLNSEIQNVFCSEVGSSVEPMDDSEIK